MSLKSTCERVFQCFPQVNLKNINLGIKKKKLKVTAEVLQHQNIQLFNEIVLCHISDLSFTG